MPLPAWLKSLFPTRKPPSAARQARDLIRAIDRGGVPLNPVRVNTIARQIGLEVSPHAPMEATIARIRAALPTVRD